jgi:hypothetical protein
MEAFEHIVKVFLESQGYVVTTNIKFPVQRRTKKAIYEEYQTHGYEVDIVGAKSNSLLLGSVKSFFGSGGVNKQGFKGIADPTKKTHYDSYKMFNVPEIRDGIIKEASSKYNYPREQIQLCIFVGRFSFGEEQIITNYLEEKHIKVYNLQMIVEGLLEAAKPNTYMNDPVVVTIKALQLAGFLTKHKN